MDEYLSKYLRDHLFTCLDNLQMPGSPPDAWITSRCLDDSFSRCLDVFLPRCLADSLSRCLDHLQMPGSPPDAWILILQMPGCLPSQMPGYIRGVVHISVSFSPSQFKHTIQLRSTSVKDYMASTTSSIQQSPLSGRQHSALEQPCLLFVQRRQLAICSGSQHIS